MTTSWAGVLAGALLLTVVDAAMAEGAVSEAHAGTRKGAVYEATPQPYVAPTAGNAAGTGAARGGSGGGSTATPAVSGAEGGSAPVEPGAGVEIISGGGGSEAGTAKVGHLPVLQ